MGAGENCPGGEGRGHEEEGGRGAGRGDEAEARGRQRISTQQVAGKFTLLTILVF